MAAVSYVSPRFQALDLFGRPFWGAKLYTYINKTTTPAPTYQFVDGTGPNTNPIVLDARGEAVVYLDAGQVYTFVLRGRLNELIWSQDDIVGGVTSIDFQEFVDALAVDGAERIGWEPDIPTTINFSVKKALDETVDLRTKFGLTGKLDDDQTEAWNDFITYINTLPKGGGAALLKGTIRIAGAHLQLNRSIALNGEGPARTQILFDGVDCLDIDLSSINASSIGMQLNDMALLTNTTGKKGLRWVGNAGASNTIKLFSRGLRIDSLSRFNGTLDTNTWEFDTAIQIGRPGLGFSQSNMRFDNLEIYGSDLSNQYGTRTNAQGIIVYDSSGIKINGSRIVLVGQDAIQFNGFCEGTAIHDCDLVAVNRGIVYPTGTTEAPASGNHHSISSTHVAAFTRGIAVQDTGNATPRMAVQLDKLFILERGETVAKADMFIGVECVGRIDDLNSVQVYSNQAPVGTSLGFRLGTLNCKATQCHAHNMKYVLDVVGYAGLPTSSTAMIDGIGYSGSSTIDFLYPSSIKPFGSYRLPNYNTVRYENSHQSYDSDGLNLYRFTGGSLLLGNAGRTDAFIDTKHSAGASGADGRLYCSSGASDGSNYGGSWIMYGSVFRMDAPVTPHADNAYNLGSPSLRWTQVFAANTTISSSDARLKGPVAQMTTSEIEAAKLIAKEIGLYQWLDAINEKGEDDARWHAGLTVQRAIEIMTGCGLDPMSYGFICYDAWGAEPEIRHVVEAAEAETMHHDEVPALEIGGVVVREAIPAWDEVVKPAVEASDTLMQPAREAGDLYSFRYEQLNLFIARGLEARIAALESLAP